VTNLSAIAHGKLPNMEDRAGSHHRRLRFQGRGDTQYVQSSVTGLIGGRSPYHCIGGDLTIDGTYSAYHSEVPVRLLDREKILD
jgi:hypothetical protein